MAPPIFGPPVFGIVGWKNAGKTTLTERLVAHLTAAGLAVSTIKHAHHEVEIDRPGKDSFRHRQAGAVEVILATARRTMLVHELRDVPEPGLGELVGRLRPVDLVLVEGFKRDPHPKLEVSRKATAQRLHAHDDPTVLALACDYAPEGLELPRFALDDVPGIARFVRQTLGR